MEPLDSIAKAARDCHTKHAWEALFIKHGDLIASANHSRPIQEIFKLLQADPQSLQYAPSIWGQLISGCLSSWNHDLGREIAELVRKLPSPRISIPSAQLQLESGHPTAAREIANRALRLAGLSSEEKLQLEMLICSSYAEEGKHARAIRMLNRMAPTVRDPHLPQKNRADFLTQMARMQYFLGRYNQAGEIFQEAAKLHLSLNDWEAGAKALFNTAACIHNSGGKRQDQAFAFVEQCRRIAQTHNLPGPVSHCESFYGLDAYQHGNFAGARDHFRRALSYLPAADKSFRRLHILSMLSLSYLAQGRYHLAKKFGRQTLDLAALDESERFKLRYVCLDAELQWESGDIETSQQILRAATAPLEVRGVHNLEELSTLGRYTLQSALVGEHQRPIKIKIDEPLKKNLYNWLDYLHSMGQLHLNQDQLADARQVFEECLTRARGSDDRKHEALGLLGIMQTLLRQRHGDHLEPYASEFEVAVAKIGETPLKTQVDLVNAGCAYQQGNFNECVRLLRLAAKSPRLSFVDQFNINACLATIEGKSPRLTSPWQISMFARFSKTYFAPSLKVLDDRNFMVSDHYLVNLERHPALADLLHFLLRKSNFSALTSEVQTHVWKQSLQTQGWAQKIRNTVMRLRDFFPFTIAPILIHGDNVVSLYHHAIAIQAPRIEGAKTEDEILRLLHDSPMSSVQLSHRLRISSATTKRVLKKLAEDSEIMAIKDGRNVVYSARDKETPGIPASH